ESWDSYLLFTTAVFFTLAYRFDNWFVLSLALSTLAGWFGVRVSRWHIVSDDSLRVFALLYAAVVISAGTWLYRRGIKKHFLDAYLHVAANVVLASMLSGLGDQPYSLLWAALLVGSSAASIGLGIRYRRFAFVLYGMVYGY